MQHTKFALSLLALGAMNAGAATIWSLGTDAPGRAPGALEPSTLNGDSFNVTFVQETGNNDLPGDPNSPAVDQQADDDYYFAGTYTNQVDGGAVYAPIGVQASSEIAVERAFTSSDVILRYHFNFPAASLASDEFRFTFKMLDHNDDGTGTGAFNITTSINGNDLDSFVSTAANIDTVFTGSTFNLADAGGTAGAPDDNYIQVAVTNGGDTTARWANVDYLELEVNPVPEPTSTGLLFLSLAGLGFIRRRK